MWRVRRAAYFEIGLIAWMERADVRKDELNSRMKLMGVSSSRLPVRDSNKAPEATDLDDFPRNRPDDRKIDCSGRCAEQSVRYEAGTLVSVRSGARAQQTKSYGCVACGPWRICFMFAPIRHVRMMSCPSLCAHRAAAASVVGRWLELLRKHPKASVSGECGAVQQRLAIPVF